LFLAVYCLQQEPDLNFKLKLKNHDLRDGAGILKSQFSEGIEYSIRELIELMMIYSDNTATDLLLRRCEGPFHLTEWLKSIGIKEITITNSCFDILASYYGINHLSPDCTLEVFEAHKQETSLLAQQNASHTYLTEMPDRATPQSILLFLKKLINNELLSEDLKTFLLQCMHKSTMGAQRIRKHLPHHLFCCDKEGTLGILAADVGVILLPDNQSYILIAAYAYGGNSLQEREDRIAELSLNAYKHFSSQKF